MKIILLCMLALMPFLGKTLQPSYRIQKDLITSQDLFPEAPYFVIDSFKDRFEFELSSEALEGLFKNHQFLLERSLNEKIKFYFSLPFETQKAKEQITQAFLDYFEPFNPKVTKINLKPLTEIASKEVEVLGIKMQSRAFKKNKFSLMLEIAMEGQKGFLPFWCEIDASLEVLIAKEAIKAGEDLSEKNFTKQRIGFDALPFALAQEKEAYASSSRSFIAKGSVIFASKLKPQIIVKRGDEIEVLFEEENILIRTRLQAMQNASLGQEINAKNLQSQKIIRVKIIGKGKGSVL